FAGWSKLKKTKYYYALNGRGDNDGVMQMLDCIKLSDGIILCPLSNIEKMREFLDAWEIDYKYIPILIPERMNKKNILKS
ncbi:hypothetical protein KY362_00130, partial [Candidatus Woesearchaeota archaeon]|nr:hypothetical protein [Candidatus Woesearchaeota archaeon]